MAFDLGANQLTVEVYAGISTLQRVDPYGDLRNATIESFSKTYPSGLYVACSIFVPRDVSGTVEWRGWDRLVIRNGLKVAWEGVISGIGYNVSSNGQQGIRIEGIGGWGGMLSQYTLDKRWADDRVSIEAWKYRPSAGGAELARIDRQDRLRTTPRAEAWGNGEACATQYLMPTGQTVKRVTCDYDMQEAAQAWELRLRDIDNAATIFGITSSGTGSQDDTLATPSQTIEIQWISFAAQTPTSDGTYYGEISNIMVYSETGSINLTEIAKDIQSTFSANINSDESYINSNTYTLEPFYTKGQEACSRILERAAAYGDSSQNSWACMLISSEAANSPDGKPVLKVEQIPDLSDFDYAVRLDEPNVLGQVEITRDFGNIINWVSVKYRDEENDRDVILTPDDDSTLGDGDSQTKWGEKRISQPLNLRNAGATVATNYARRFLAENKDPKWIMATPLTMIDTIRSKEGVNIPVSQVEPGKRVKVENFLHDLSGQAGAGLTFLITNTDHSDNGKRVSISAGQSNSLAVMLAQIAYNQKAGLQNTNTNDREAFYTG